MNFGDIQDEIIQIRFKESQRASVKHWINSRYSWIWSQADWPFKKSFQQNLTITAADFTPTSPSDLGRVLAIYDELGDKLEYMSPMDFEASYVEQTAQSRPSAYTVVNYQIYLAPIPSASATFTIDYERKIARSVAGTPTAGLMSGDSDEPLWDDEHHFLLVMGAMATGLKLENDPTWDAPEAEFQVLFDAMRNDLLPPDQSENLQYGRDNL